jgi:hypothetical protein
MPRLKNWQRLLLLPKIPLRSRNLVAKQSYYFMEKIQVIKATIEGKDGHVKNECIIPVASIISFTPYLENMYYLTLLSGQMPITKFTVEKITATIMPEVFDVLNAVGKK